MIVINYFISLMIVILSMISGKLMFLYRRLIDVNQMTAETPPISIIIPARNERSNLPKLLKSINANNTRTEVIVVDDDSTDDTRGIAEACGPKAIQVSGHSKYKGKSNACWQGALQASHSFLLFIDADVELTAKESLSRIYGQYEKQSCKGLLSIQPYHMIKNKYENLSAIFNLFTLVGMNAFSYKHHNNKNIGAFGPVVFTNKQDYLTTEGHLNVQGAIIEGFAISKAYDKLGLPVEIYEGANIVNFRMYPEGLSSLVNGWSKHFASGSSITKRSVMFMTMSWLFGSITSVLLIIFGLKKSMKALIISLIMYGSYALQFLILIKRVGNFNKVISLLHPVFSLCFVIIHAKSWMDIHVFKTVKWKDRKIDLNAKLEYRGEKE